MSQTLYFGGKILTMDKKNPYAQAVITDDNKIIAVGSFDELADYIDDAKLFDLKGKTLMPAFVDGHSHISNTGLYLNKCDITECKDFNGIGNTIKHFIQKNNIAPDKIISCFGYDNEKLKEKSHPGSAFLDTLGIPNPIYCLHVSGHMITLNSAAMKYCNIYSPDGVLYENSAFEAIKKLDVITDEIFTKAILDAQDLYIKNGFATIQDGSGLILPYIKCYETLANQNKLKADTVIYISHEIMFTEEIIPLIKRLGNRVYKNKLKLGGIKIFLDGSPQAKTAWMSEPYENDTCCGFQAMQDDRLFEILEKANEIGLQTIAHCNGDAACEQFIYCYEKLCEKYPYAKNLRPVMIHAQTVTKNQLERMKKINMTPSFFIGHTYFWGDIHLKNLGERAYNISPLADALSLKLPFSLHQDSPVTKPNMLHSVWCATCRETQSGKVLGKNQIITVYDALVAATTAFGYFEEKNKGIIKVGAYSNFIVLDKDPEKNDPRKINVISTINF